MMSRAKIAFLLFFTALALLFLFMPELDIKAAATFYKEGSGFHLEKATFCRGMYALFPKISILSALIFIIIAVIESFRPGFTKVRRRVALYLLLSLVIGPGLIVNVILKKNVGRARPRAVKEFGGHKTFTPAFVLSDQRGKSFVSGHASGAYFFLSFVPLAPQKQRRLVFVVTFLFGSLMGLVRMMMGGHFLSDVIFAFVVVWVTSQLLHEYMFPLCMKSEKNLEAGV